MYMAIFMIRIMTDTLNRCWSALQYDSYHVRKHRQVCVFETDPVAIHEHEANHSRGETQHDDRLSRFTRQALGYGIDSTQRRYGPEI